MSPPDQRDTVRPEDVAAHYDELDPFYRELWGEHLHHGLWDRGDESPEEAVRRLVDRAARSLELEAGARICDVGAGYGATARYLAVRYGARVTAVTLSGVQHRLARRRGIDARSSVAGSRPVGSVTYRREDWLENELPSDGFDAAIALESTAHMADLDRCLVELRRTLRPDGRAVICAWLAEEGAKDAWSSRALLEAIRRGGRLRGLPSPSDYRRALQKAGFAGIRFDDLTGRVRKTWRVVVRRMLVGLVRRPDYRRYMRDGENRQREFALTAGRILLAQHLGVMRYGLFRVRAPDYPG